MKKLKTITLLIASALIWAACGGGDDPIAPSGGDNNTPSTPTNPTNPTDPTDPTPPVKEKQTFTAPMWINSVTPVPAEQATSSIVMYVSLPQELVAGLDGGDELAAFCGDECKMVLTLTDKTLEKNVWSCMINDLKVGDKLTLKYYSAKTKYMYVTTSPVTITDVNMNYGSFDNPMPLTMSVIYKD